MSGASFSFAEKSSPVPATDGSQDRASRLCTRKAQPHGYAEGLARGPSADGAVAARAAAAK
jgi:hypothetical protein